MKLRAPEVFATALQLLFYTELVITFLRPDNNGFIEPVSRQILITGVLQIAFSTLYLYDIDIFKYVKNLVGNIVPSNLIEANEKKTSKRGSKWKKCIPLVQTWCH